MFTNAAIKLMSLMTSSPEVSQMPENTSKGPNQYVMLAAALVLLAIWLIVLRFKKVK